MHTFPFRAFLLAFVSFTSGFIGMFGLVILTQFVKGGVVSDLAINSWPSPLATLMFLGYLAGLLLSTVGLGQHVLRAPLSIPGALLGTAVAGAIAILPFFPAAGRAFGFLPQWASMLMLFAAAAMPMCGSLMLEPGNPSTPRKDASA